MSVYRADADSGFVVHVSPDRGRGQWIVDAYFRGARGSRRTCSRCPTEADARTLAEDIWRAYVAGQITAPDPAPATVLELVERFVARTEGRAGRRLSARTGRAYASQLQALVAVCGGLPVSHLARRHVEAACRRPPSPASAQAYLRAARALLRWAVRRGWAAVDVTDGIALDGGPQSVGSYLQPAEVPAFLAACTPSLRVRAGLIVETGLRGGEAAHLRWSWVTRGIGRPSIRVPAHDPASGFTAKGRRARPIPLSAEGARWLAQAAERWGPDGFVLHGQPEPARHDNWSSRARLRGGGPNPGGVRGACELAGVTLVGLHGLRRTAGVIWLSAGLSIYQVQRLLGHESVTTTERAYADVLQSDLADAFARVDVARAVPRLPVYHRVYHGETEAPEGAPDPHRIGADRRT